MKAITDVNPSLTDTPDVSSKSISDEILDGLKLTLQAVQFEKKKRIHKVCKQVYKKKHRNTYAFAIFPNASKLSVFPQIPLVNLWIDHVI